MNASDAKKGASCFDAGAVVMVEMERPAVAAGCCGFKRTAVWCGSGFFSRVLGCIVPHHRHQTQKRRCLLSTDKRQS